MSHVSTPWTLLASRVARGLLSRKGVTLKQLTERFSTLQIEDTARGIDGKIARGTYSLAFFLQLLRAIRSEYPNQWAPIVALDLDFEAQATFIFSKELATHGLDLASFFKRLSGIGVGLSEEEIEVQIARGTFPFVLLLQLAAVANIEGIERFVDACDVSEAAIMAARRETRRKLTGDT